MLAGGGDDEIVVGGSGVGTNGINAALTIDGDLPGADTGVDFVTVDDTADTSTTPAR